MFEGPVDDGMTLAVGAMFASWLVVAFNAGVFVEFWCYVIGVCIIIALLGPPARAIAGWRGLNTVNSAKTQEQLWQFGVHVAMTVLNLGALAFVDNEASMFDGTPMVALDTAIRRVYTVQTAVWFVTAARHRFLAARGKDYILMYAHHTITLLLVVGSFANGSHSRRMGVFVLLLHDSSDILVDIMRLAHDLGLDGSSGTYIAEVSFVANLFTWVYIRLYRFPIAIVASLNTGNALHDGLNAFLCALLCMHAYWFYLFGRIAWRLVSSGKGGHDAGREYEGESESEGSDMDGGKMKHRHSQ